MPIIQKTYEPTERASQIIALANEANQGAQEAKKRARKSIEEGIECGRLLIEEQADVTKRLGKGTWASYFDITFSKTLPLSTANAWMKMARDTANRRLVRQPMATIEPLTQTQPQELSNNTLRQGMANLNLLPAKEHEPTPSSGPTIATPKQSTHLSLINRLIAWHSELLTQHQGTLTQEHRSQLLQDFAPVISLIDTLRA